nr:unnamed protein product [Spirometra erinaceieuropaei]
MISPTPQGAVEDPTNLLHRLRQFMRTLSPVPPRYSASPSYLEKDLATCSHVYYRCDRVRRPLEPPYDGPFRVLSRGMKTFRIQRDNREEVVSVDRLKAAVPDTPPDELCGPLPLLRLPDPLSLRPVYFLCPHTPTTPSAPLRPTFGLAGGYGGSSRLLASAFVTLPSCPPHTPCRYAAGTRECWKPINAVPTPIGWRVGDNEGRTHARTQHLEGGHRQQLAWSALAATAYRALVSMVSSNFWIQRAYRRALYITGLYFCDRWEQILFFTLFFGFVSILLLSAFVFIPSDAVAFYSFLRSRLQASGSMDSEL